MNTYVLIGIWDLDEKNEVLGVFSSFEKAANTRNQMIDNPVFSFYHRYRIRTFSLDADCNTVEDSINA